MPGINSVFEEAKRVPIETLLSRYGLDVGVGRKWQAVRCPFHKDRTPSASVNTTEGVFVCHAGCVSGDVIAVAQFAEEFESARDAAEWLLTQLTRDFTSDNSARVGRWRDGCWIED